MLDTRVYDERLQDLLAMARKARENGQEVPQAWCNQFLSLCMYMRDHGFYLQSSNTSPYHERFVRQGYGPYNGHVTCAEGPGKVIHTGRDRWWKLRGARR